ncbi:hypothetical protein B0H67DRAFT_659328, partial [Lasiosphaeris hirsuta]
NPIGNGLDAFRASFSSICQGRKTSSPDVAGLMCSVDNCTDLQNVVLDLLSALRNLRAIRLLGSKTNHGPLRSDLLKLNSAVSSDGFDLDRIKPLLISALDGHSGDALIWKHVYGAVTESTPPPRPVASSLRQTALLHTTSGLANSSEYRLDVDPVLILSTSGSAVSTKHTLDAWQVSKQRLRPSPRGAWTVAIRSLVAMGGANGRRARKRTTCWPGLAT